MHRALRRFTWDAQLLVGALLLTAAHTLGYVLLYPVLAELWEAALRLGIDRLGLPATLSQEPLRIGALSFGRLGIDLAAADWHPRQGLGHGAAIGALWLLSLRLPPAWLPCAYALRLLCLLHGLVLLFFLVSTLPFPYRVLQHTRDLFTIGSVTIALVPTLLALTYYPFERSWLRRVAGTQLIMLYFVIALPIQQLAHALLISWSGAVMMPVLFLLFGPLLNTLAFVALYSWVITWEEWPESGRTRTAMRRSH